MSVSLPGSSSGSSVRTRVLSLRRRHVRPHLEAHRVFDAPGVLHVGALDLVGALAHPGQVRAQVVDAVLVGDRAGEGLLVGQQQRLVARVERDAFEGVELLLGHGLDEVNRVPDRVDEGVVLLRERRVVHEVEVPVLRVPEVREAPLGEGPDEVEGEGGAGVGLHHPLRVRAARLRREFGAVDDVAPVAGERRAVARLGVRGARLGVLPRKAPDPHDARVEPVGEHEAHLHQNLEPAGDDVGPAVAERLGALPALQQKPVPLRGPGDLRLEVLNLPRRDERGEGRDVVELRLQRRLVGIGGLLKGVFFAPGVKRPVLNGGLRHGQRSVRTTMSAWTTNPAAHTFLEAWVMTSAGDERDNHRRRASVTLRPVRPTNPRKRLFRNPPPVRP